MCLIESCPKTAVLLSTFFNGFLNSLPTQILRIEFLEKFTESINNFSWNATCLLFISRVFYCIDSSLTNNLSPNLIKNFHKIIKCSISTQEIFIRSATQTFITKALIKHINPKELTAKLVKDFFDFIGMLSTKECLAYKTTTWNALVDWLEQAMNSESKDLVQPILLQEFNTFLEDSNTNEFTHTNEPVKIAKLILLFCDTNSEKAYKITLEALTDRLNNCNKYVYSSSEKVEKCLMIFSSLIDYLKSNFSNKFHSIYFFKCYLTFLFLIKSRTLQVLSVTLIKWCKIYTIKLLVKLLILFLEKEMIRRKKYAIRLII